MTFDNDITKFLCSVDFFFHMTDTKFIFFKIVCYLTNAVFVLITLGSVRPIFPSQDSLFVLLRHSTSMIVLGGSTMVFDCCSCFEVSNTITHLFRGVFNRVVAFLLQVWGIIASAPEHPLC